MPITQNSGELLRKQLEAEEEMWRLERESEQRAFAVKEKYEALRDFASDMSRGVSQTEAAAKALSRIALTQHIPKQMTEGEQSRLDLQRQKFEQSLIPKKQQPTFRSTSAGAIFAINPEDLSVKEIVKAPPPKVDPRAAMRSMVFGETNATPQVAPPASAVPPPTTTITSPTRGKPLTLEKAKEFRDRAKGNRAKAEELARAEGYEF